MPADILEPIRTALEAGDKPKAQALLRPLLRRHPSADCWYLAAIACTDADQAMRCLRQALAMQPQHSGAQRMLLKLEAVQRADHFPPLETLIEKSAVDNLSLQKVKRTPRGRGRRMVVILSLLLFGSACSLLTMNLIGVVSGPVTAITVLTGGATPVGEIDGMPLSMVEDAPLYVQPSQVKSLVNSDTNVLEPGYAHEYTFRAVPATEVAVYVQFLSLAANRVSRNVVVLRPDESDATATCEHSTILQGDNNITLTCPIDVIGEWKIRILGRNAESIGAYFVGVEQMSG